jgi:hypothetical protein
LMWRVGVIAPGRRDVFSRVDVFEDVFHSRHVRASREKGKYRPRPIMNSGCIDR